MAFLEGHTSYVSSIAFDTYWNTAAEDCNVGVGERGAGARERNAQNGPRADVDADDDDEDSNLREYRVVSGGQDAKLCFWDLSLEDEPMDHHQPASAASNLASAFDEKVDLSGATKSANNGGGSGGSGGSGGLILPSPSRLLTPRVSPAMCHVLHPEPIVKVIVDEREIYSVDQGSRVRVWLRPMQC